jgi:hypothetical protein
MTAIAIQKAIQTWGAPIRTPQNVMEELFSLGRTISAPRRLKYLKFLAEKLNESLTFLGTNELELNLLKSIVL